MDRQTLDYRTLVAFLINAKINTYAGMGSKEIREDGSRNYHFVLGHIEYHDVYHGNFMDCGKENVRYRGVVVWGMVYRGGMLCDYISEAKATFSFLRDALRRVPEEFPARGPPRYTWLEMEYRNIWKGDILQFAGEETIAKSGVVVYQRQYMGGRILERDSPVRLINLEDE